MKQGIVSIGECMLELSAGRDGLWHMGHAGDAFNTLWAMRALVEADLEVDFVSAFGDDPFSAQQTAFMRDNGIGRAASPTIAGARPGLYAITLEGAERRFTYWRSDSAARRLADDPASLEKSLADRRLAYFSGITLAILTPSARATLLDAIGRARAGGTLIAFDPNYRPALWPDTGAARAVIASALAHSDIALPTFGDEQELFGDATPEATAERLSMAGVAEIAVKNGDAPTLLATPGGRRRVPASPAQPVDTTGAGDAFNGGYLAARLAGDPPGDAARRAHRVAAAVIAVHGALAPFETLRTAFRASAP